MFLTSKQFLHYKKINSIVLNHQEEETASPLLSSLSSSNLPRRDRSEPKEIFLPPSLLSIHVHFSSKRSPYHMSELRVLVFIFNSLHDVEMVIWETTCLYWFLVILPGAEGWVCYRFLLWSNVNWWDQEDMPSLWGCPLSGTTFFLRRVWSCWLLEGLSSLGVRIKVL